MIDKKQNKKNKLAVFAGVSGAVVGAGAAIAGAFVLKDKKNRDKVKKVLTNVKGQAKNYLKKINKNIKNEKVELKEKLKN